MPLTLFDKIWDRHLVGTRADGKHLLYMDRHAVHELHAPHAFGLLDDSGRPVRRQDLTLVVQDHTVPTRPGVIRLSPHIEATQQAGRKHGVQVLGVNEAEHGIVHVVTPELGIALPGLTLACPDSHASTVGALGCLAFGCGTTELVHVLSTQVMAMEKPRQIRIWLDGQLSDWVNAKDVALALIRQLGVSAGRGAAVEYAGPVIEAMDIEARMTLCNMTIEWGGRTCLIAPDAKTFAWCRGRRGAPQGPAWEEAMAWWATLHSDAGAVFDEEHRLDCSGLAPQVTWGTDPGQAIGIQEAAPDPQSLAGAAQERTARALAYMAVPAGQPLVGLPVDRVFIGSCSNARLPDLRAAADVARGRHVAAGVQAWVVPGSSSIKRQAEAEGLDQVFLQAGFEWREAGCSMCAGANGDTGAPGQRCVSTTNRNFENRQGRDVRTHLTSPAMAAAAAVAGQLVDVRQLMERPA